MLGNSIYQHATNILVIEIKTWQKQIINFVHFFTLELCSWGDKIFNNFTWILYMFEHENFVHEDIKTKTTWQKKVQV
jgi:hypothetical protein